MTSDSELWAHLKALRAAARQNFQAWFLATRPPDFKDGFYVAALYRQATGQHIDWHDTSQVLEELAHAQLLQETGLGPDRMVQYSWRV